MVMVIAENTIKQEKIEHVKPLYKNVVDYTRKQAGCIFYEVYQRSSEAAAFVFIEKWASEDDLNHHLEDQEFLNIFEEIENCFRAEEVMDVYKELI